MKSIATTDEYSTEEFWLKQADGFYAQVSYSGTRVELKCGECQVFVKHGDYMWWLHNSESDRRPLFSPVWPYDANSRACLYGQWALLDEKEVDKLNSVCVE